MGFAVTGSAILKCTFGAAPSVLNVLPTNAVMVDMPVANILDQIPLMNIMPFGVCSSLANPMVAAATAAALGVLTPMPCIPMTVAPWVPGKPTVIVGLSKPGPILNDGCKLMCCWGGCISIGFAGQTRVMA